jgi:glycosyltransferase involved in cell wall biosynthesis
VVPDDDVSGFSEAILALLKDPGLRRRLAENAWKTAREKFSWERWAPRYEEIYQKTLQHWGSRA